MDKQTRVIWINSMERIVKEEFIINNTIDLRRLIGGYLECPYRFDVGPVVHNLLCWEEALLQEVLPKHWFQFEGFPTAIAGNGVIIANDEEGETINATITIESVKKMVKFISPSFARW